MKKILGIAIVFLVLADCTTGKKDYQSKVNNSEFLHRSIKAITDLIVHDIFSPPVASRIYAYSSIAGYEEIGRAHV